MTHAPESKRQRILIVVSAWCPAMLADMQRARMLAWELPKLGWDVEILTPRASEVRQDVIEPDADGFFAAGIPVHEVGSVARGLFEALGSRTHAWRTWWPIRRRGRELLQKKRFDLVYFTTTTFNYFSLGPQWHRECAVPYVLDFHDPWVKATGRAAQGSLRTRVMTRFAERSERAAVVGAEGIVSVSPAYIEQLRKRYASAQPRWLHSQRHAVIPFGARKEDWPTGATDGPRSSAGGGPIVLQYTGAGGSIMARAFDLVCRAIGALREQRHPAALRLRIELHGTTYGWNAGEEKVLEAVALKAGVRDLVHEHPERVAYRRSLELLRDCDGALIVGVDDAGYMPSKLVGYALSGRPLLVSLHRQSPAYALCESMPGFAHAVWFDEHRDMPLADAARVVAGFVDEAAAGVPADREAMLEPFLAPNMARRHADLFESCLDR